MADELIMIDDVCGLPEALHAKQDTLVFDSSPVVGSKNPVTSGGIYDFVTETAQAISDATSSSITDISSSVSSELAKKADKVHSHTIDDVCGLPEALSSIKTYTSGDGIEIDPSMAISISPVKCYSGLTVGPAGIAVDAEAKSDWSLDYSGTVYIGSDNSLRIGKASKANYGVFRVSQCDTCSDGGEVYTAPHVYHLFCEAAADVKKQIAFATESINCRIDEIVCGSVSYATKQDLDDLCRLVFTDTASVNIQDYSDGFRTAIGWYGKLSSLGVSSSSVDLRSVTFKRGCVSAATPSVAYVRVVAYVDGELTVLYRSSVGTDWPSTEVNTPVVFQLEPSTSRRVSSSDSIYIVLSDCACGDAYTVGTQFGLVATNGGSGSVSCWPTGPGQGAPCIVTGYTPNIGITYIDASSSGSLEGRVENSISVLRQETIDAKDSVIYSLCELDKVVSGKQDAISAGCNISITGSTVSAILPAVDATPTDGSENLVTSGGVKSYVDQVTGYILTALDEV